MNGMRETRSLHDLKAEIVSLKKSNSMKDDTIAFLQREKETLLKEVKTEKLKFDTIRYSE